MFFVRDTNELAIILVYIANNITIMRTLAILIILSAFFLSAKMQAQDLHWGFEDWELVDGIENPIGWEVNNLSSGLDTVISRFYKDSINVAEGNYSLRAEKDSIISSAFFNCTSMASLYQELEVPISPNQSVFFNVKTEALTNFSESYIEVIVGLSEGNEFLGRVVWNSYEEIVDWEEIEVPIPFDGGTSMSIQINAASQNGATDGCHLESIIWLDDLRITESSTNSTKSIETTLLNVYPNPTNGKVYFKKSEYNGSIFTVTDLMGRIVHQGIVADNKINLSHIGLNIIRLHTANQATAIIKVINLGLE